MQRHKNSQVFLDIFGSFDVQISYLIVIGRDAFILAADRGRYAHRQSSMTIGQSTVSIVTYDEARADIADRLGIESAVKADPHVLD